MDTNKLIESLENLADNYTNDNDGPIAESGYICGIDAAIKLIRQSIEDRKTQALNDYYMPRWKAYLERLANESKTGE